MRWGNEYAVRIWYYSSPGVRRKQDRLLWNPRRDGNKCSNGRQHRRQCCNNWGSKAIRHSENRPTSMSPSSASSDEVSSLRQQFIVLSTRLEKIEAQCSKIPSCSTRVVSWNQTLTSPPGPPGPLASDQPSSSPTLFGLPAVSARPAKSESQLQNRNILLMDAH